MKRSRLDPTLARALGGKAAANSAAPPPPGHRAGMCAAFGCRLPGSLAEHSGSSSWWCAFHYAANPVDLPRITQVLLQNSALVSAMIASRKFHASENSAMASGTAEWDEAHAMVAAAGYSVDRGRSFRAFAFECETVLGGLVVQTLTRSKRDST